MQSGQAGDQRIPYSRTRLIGREREVQDVLALVADPDVALVTLTGPGGIGKTRIALEVAKAMEDRGEATVIFIDLSAIRDPALVVPEIARRAGIRANKPDELIEQLSTAIGGRAVLMILDNFEQVVGAAPDICEVLDACPSLMLLVTSRSRLQLDREREYGIGALPVPDQVDLLSTEELASFDSVRLFVQRARWAHPAFELTPDIAMAVTQICVQLDGLPLAIELAASRSHVLPPTAMRSRLQRLLPLLTGGSRDLPERQQTMQRAITWSYELLPPQDQRFFRAMAVFTDGFRFEAADALADALFDERVNTLASLSALVDQSFLKPTTGLDGEPRYRMLETIREFGLEQVAVTGEEAMLRDAHAGFFLAFAADVARAFRPVIHLPAVDRLEADVANFRAALGWLLDTGRDDDAQRLAVTLRRFWFLAGHEREGLTWLARILDRAPDASDAIRAEALLTAAELSQRLHEPTAHAFLTRMFNVGPGNLNHHADGIQLMGIMAEDLGDHDQAEELLTMSRAMYEQLEEPWYPLVVDYHLGIQAYGKGDLERARALMETARSAAAALGDVLVPAWCTPYLALIACQQDDPRSAAIMLRQLHRPAHGPALPSLHAHHHPMYLSSVAVLAVTIGEWAIAARLFGAASADPRASVVAMPEAVTFERAQARARARMPETLYAEAWNAGRRLHQGAIRDEIDHLLDLAEHHPSAPADGHEPSPLTPRELDVLRLVATGQSNQEIADALYLSPGTVKVHVTHILAKLGLASRAAATDYAHRHHLT